MRFIEYFYFASCIDVKSGVWHLLNQFYVPDPEFHG